jgi:hypothetical protein
LTLIGSYTPLIVNHSSMNKLFIYIPTFNRPLILKTQLEILLPQVTKRIENVRLLISDNNSNNYEVTDLIKEYKDNVNIKVRKYEHSIGGNANLAMGFVDAKKDEFLWMLSDNDIVSENAVEQILINLDKSLDFIVLVNTVNEKVDLIHDWEVDYEKPMGWGMGKIDYTIYNMESVGDSVAEAFFYHNSSFPHLAVAYSVGKKRGKTKFRLLSRHNIIAKELQPSEELVDYSMAWTGMALLAPLLSLENSKKFSRKWLISKGVMFYISKDKYPNIYIQSKITLRKYGGWLIYIIEPYIFIIATIVNPYIKNRKTIINMLKKYLSENKFKKLKSIRDKLIIKFNSRL